MKWAEFAGYTPVAATWVEQGNVAIVPYIIRRKGGGVSRYMVARDRAVYVAACRELDAEPSDLPANRASINVDGRLLMRALVKCRRSALGPVATAQATRLALPAGDEPWESKCPTCRLPFHIIAEHTLGDLVSSTSAACAAGHRWPV